MRKENKKKKIEGKKMKKKIYFLVISLDEKNIRRKKIRIVLGRHIHSYYNNK